MDPDKILYLFKTHKIMVKMNRMSQQFGTEKQH